MVNLWPGVPANCLCDKHLNAVLHEYHNLLMPSIRKGHSIKGYILHGCVDLPTMGERIMECLRESRKRGKNWDYLPIFPSDVVLHSKLVKYYGGGFPNIDNPERRKEMAEMNRRILAFRCPECRERLIGYLTGGDDSVVQ